MAWDFEQMIQYARKYADGLSGMELAFVFSEWDQAEGLGLMSAYPVEREDLPPTEDMPAYLAKKIWVKLNSGAWQQLVDVSQVTNIGQGKVGVVTGGVSRGIVLAGWKAKSIAAGYITALSSTMDQINSERTTGVALIRIMANEDDGENPFDPSEPFTQAQITALNTWLSEHDVTPQEFAALFNKTATELADDLKTEPRWKLAEEIHDRFS